jgi:hypothetical protein
VIKNYTQSFDMYVSKGALWIEKLRSHTPGADVVLDEPTAAELFR